MATRSRRSAPSRGESGNRRSGGRQERSSGRSSSRSTRSSGGSSRRSSVPAGFRGSAGVNRLQDELRRQEEQKELRKQQAGQPFRFRLAPGESAEIIVLDDQLDDLFFMYEHNLKDQKTGYWNIFTGCIKEHDDCPVCAVAERESYYALMLSIIDLREFEDRKGNLHEFSRKLMPVKSTQISKFLRRQEREGTLRGAVFECSRDGDRDPQIGNDIEFIEMLEERDLEGYVREYEDREGKRHTEDCAEVLDYDALFPEPDKESLRKMVGGEHTPGSREQSRSELSGSSRRRRGRQADQDMEEDESEFEDENEDAPFDTDEEERPARGRRSRAASSTRSTRRSRRDEAEEEEEPEQEEAEQEEEEAPRGRRGRASRAGSRRTARAQSDDFEDEGEEESEEQEEEEAPRARRGRSSGPKPPARRVRRGK